MFGTALQANATKVLLLGSGELGKEVAIECQRYGIEVIAVDRYAQAPAMQIAHKSYVINMLDGAAIKEIVTTEQPDFIVPEIEAIATTTLVELEAEGFNIVPKAKATLLTMNREGIRNLAAIDLGIKTSNYAFANTLAEFRSAVNKIGMPCVVKPIMSSSGKGQSVIKDIAGIDNAWEYSQEGGRAGGGRVIIESFVDFDYEITLLTVRAIDGVHFCLPIGHHQVDGDYRESWQPQAMSKSALANAELIGEKIVNALGGYGLFGVELFVKGDEVIFSEVSPRPHDTGMVTMISQDQSEFALHVRAFLQLPINEITHYGASASAVILGEGNSHNIRFANIKEALSTPLTQIRLFAKPEIKGKRRLGVVLNRAKTTKEATMRASSSAAKIKVIY